MFQGSEYFIDIEKSYFIIRYDYLQIVVNASSVNIRETCVTCRVLYENNFEKIEKIVYTRIDRTKYV